MIQEVEKSTTAWRLEGEWITKLYLEGKKGGKLKLKNKRVLGECEEACKTVEYAAQQVMGEHDAEVGEALYMVGGGMVLCWWYGFVLLVVEITNGKHSHCDIKDENVGDGIMTSR